MIARVERIFLLSLGGLFLLLLLSGCSGSSATALLAGTSWPGITTYGDVIYVAAGPQVLAIQSDEQGADVLWAFPDEAQRGVSFYAAPAVDDTLLVVGDYSGNVFAVNPESGRQVWQAQTGTTKFIGSPVFDESFIYIAGGNGVLHALDRDSGAEAWSYTAEQGIWSTPLLQDGVLYVTSLDRHLYAIDAQTGELSWQFPKDGQAGDTPSAGMLGTPLIVNDTIYVSSLNNELYAIDLATQQVRWTYSASNWMWSSPTYLEAENLLIGGDLDGNVFALNAETGEAAWTYEAAGPVVGNPAPGELNGEPVVYITSGIESGETNLYVLNVADGSPADTAVSVKADFTTRFLFFNTGVDTRAIPIFAPPQIYNDMILLGAHQGDFPLYALDLETLVIQWRCNFTEQTCL